MSSYASSTVPGVTLSPRVSGDEEEATPPQASISTSRASPGPGIARGTAALALNEMLPVYPTTNVLCLYIGGTIGMKKTAAGLRPVPQYLTKVLSRSSQFHDPLQPPLTTKPTKYGRRIHYVIKEYPVLLDSSQMSQEDWKRIAIDIRDHYDDYDAFIVFHGTDTLAYTASALSFMCRNLTKPIILTGSLIPISETYNDASDNIYGALMIAGHFKIPEVCIYFNHKLFRGNRTTKFDASGPSLLLSALMASHERRLRCIRLAQVPTTR